MELQQEDGYCQLIRTWLNFTHNICIQINGFWICKS
jgi:hypothetical protein